MSPILRRWSRPTRLLFGVLLVAAFCLPAAPAHAKSSWNIVRYDVVAIPELDGGQTTVVVDFDVFFGDQPSQGPTLTLLTRVKVAGFTDLWRVLDTKVESVTSSSGANTDVSVKRRDPTMTIQIGSRRHQVSGVQNYRLVYRVHGLLMPDAPYVGGDVFDWTLISPDWGVNLAKVSVTIEAPVAAVRNGCRQGVYLETPCPNTAPPSAVMTWRLSRLQSGEGLKVVAGFPAGTFTNAEYATWEPGWHLHQVVRVSPGIIAWSLGIGLASLVAVMGSLAAVRRWDARPVKSSASQPPLAEVGPGEMAFLVDDRTNRRDAPATVVQLAVRGYLRLSPPDPAGNSPDHSSASRPSALSVDQVRTELDDLEPFERRLVKKVGSSTGLTEASAVGYALARRVTGNPWGWYVRAPWITRTAAGGMGIALIVVGVLFSLVLGYSRGWALVPLGLCLAGAVMVALSRYFVVRTPSGARAYQEATELRQRLKAPDPNYPNPQVEIGSQHPEGIDLFSHYLPYAIALGVADDWIQGFTPLVNGGHYVPDLNWLAGTDQEGWWWLSSGTFGAQLNALLYPSTAN